MNSTVHDARRTARLVMRHLRFWYPFAPQRRSAAKLGALATLFRTVNGYLRHLQVEHWIVDGTLLGYHRDGHIMMHDSDIDFGAHEQEYETIWQARVDLPSGYRMYDTSCRHRGPKLYIAYKGWEADIYFYEDRNGLLQSYADEPTAGYSEPFPRDFIYPLAETQFLGETTWVPQRVVAYLEHAYGYIGADAVQDGRHGYWRKES